MPLGPSGLNTQISKQWRKKGSWGTWPSGFTCEMTIKPTCVVVCTDLPDRTAKLMSIRGLLMKLAPANYAVLEYIVAHLHRSVHSTWL